MKESGHLSLIGKELIEDKVVLLPKLGKKQVVERIAGAR